MVYYLRALRVQVKSFLGLSRGLLFRVPKERKDKTLNKDVASPSFLFVSICLFFSAYIQRALTPLFYTHAHNIVYIGEKNDLFFLRLLSLWRQRFFGSSRVFSCCVQKQRSDETSSSSSRSLSLSSYLSLESRRLRFRS